MRVRFLGKEGYTSVYAVVVAFFFYYLPIIYSVQELIIKYVLTLGDVVWRECAEASRFS